MNHDSLTIRVRHEPGYVLLAAAALRLARTLAEALQALPAAPGPPPGRHSPSLPVRR
jgi:hypothetical protein